MSGQHAGVCKRPTPGLDRCMTQSGLWALQVAKPEAYAFDPQQLLLSVSLVLLRLAEQPDFLQALAAEDNYEPQVGPLRHWCRQREVCALQQRRVEVWGQQG